MIASLRGTVQAKTTGSVVLDVHGVGYLVQIPKSVSISAQLGDQLFLSTTLIVRDDSWQLYGFETTEQQGLFDLLRSVSGVGPKTALTIISSLSPAEISLAVTSDDSKPFESVSGVGIKTAKLINVTLAGKLKATSAPGGSLELDLLAALQSLGWSEKIAGPVAHKVCQTSSGKDLPILIRECLALLGK